MSTAPDELVDAKAGHSTMCRRGDHALCATAQARCTCSCHPAPQGLVSRAARPRADVDRKPRIVEAMYGFRDETDPPKPAPRASQFACPDCGRDDFRSAGALGTHRTRKHKPKAEPTVFVHEPPPAATERHLVVVDLVEPAIRAFALLEDAQAAVELLRLAGQRAWLLEQEAGRG